MAKFSLVPRHVTCTLSVIEATDVAVTLRAALRDFDNVPESIRTTLDVLLIALDGDIPELPQTDGGATVAS